MDDTITIVLYVDTVDEDLDPAPGVVVRANDYDPDVDEE
jgi:hypothetical protein